jgi:ferric-dicitrate binding protein FerR (iron transport regulator)
MKESRQQEFLELLTNEDFKRWVLEPTYERDVFWDKWLENHPEKSALVIAAKEFIRTKKFREYSIASEEKDRILSAIISKTEINKSSAEERKLGSKYELRRSLFQYPASLYRIAAVLFFIATFIGVAYWNLKSERSPVSANELTFVKKENPQGRKSVVMLPDGTKVTLNSASMITYDSNFGVQDRTVRIEGEAFFEVIPDTSHPFRVVSNDIVTTALGTSFNVRSFANESSLNISLLTGKVKVTRIGDQNTTEEHLLSPGEGFIITRQNGEIERVTVDALKVYGWKDGILVFKDNDLSEVVSTLERWYDVRIEVIGRPEKSWRADGKFDNETLEQVLQGLSFTYDMEFLINRKNVELKFN